MGLGENHQREGVLTHAVHTPLKDRGEASRDVTPTKESAWLPAHSARRTYRQGPGQRHISGGQPGYYSPDGEGTECRAQGTEKAAV